MKHAESRQKRLTWEYSDLGDSKLDDVYVQVNYCEAGTARCEKAEFNGTSGVLEKLERKTKYTFTIQVLDRTFLKSSKISQEFGFTTEEKGMRILFSVFLY